MLVEPERTRYDVNFRVLGFPVRVHPLFWAGAALLGARSLDQPNGTLYLLVWVAVVFASILMHELGHALAYRRFWVESHIVLYIFGGLTAPWTGVPARWRRIVVSLAGPVAGFLLAAAVYGSNELYPWAGRGTPALVRWLYYCLVWVNVVWGVFNLLPVFPLDGGQVSRELCEAASRRNGMKNALRISVAVAGLIAVYSLVCEFERRNPGGVLSGLPWWLRGPDFFTAILFGMLAVQSYQLLRQLAQPYYYYEDADDRPPWRR